ncbi:MAG: hypothetical protein A2Z31_08015 [candidate division NC10 bacterium RBG_16_65_8]|nr:MAG: hypothetical protein A2Z31_08015 [candidate division NC10 bacterium RBG_16_65_8]
MQIVDVVQGLAAGVGIDLSPDGKTAYYVEWSIGELSKVDTATGKVTTVATGLSYPEDVEVDWAANQVFVSERTGAIKKIWPGEKTVVVAKPGGAPQQLALVKKASKRYLYTVCFDSGLLKRVDVDTGVVTTIAKGLGHPIGLALDKAAQYAYVTEQDKASLTRVTLASGAQKVLYVGLVSPFFLGWEKPSKSVFCVQRDPANSLVRLTLGATVGLSTVASGLAWRPSGVASNKDNSLIYICADQTLQVISFDGGPHIEPGPAPFTVYSVEFSFDKSSAIPLKNHISGSLVPHPEWVKGVRNEPAAYIKGALPKIRVVFKKAPAYVAGAYAVGATGNLGGIRRKSVTPAFQASGLSAPLAFELMWPLPGTVGKPKVTLQWYARPAPGPALTASVGSTNHKIFLLVDKPVGPWQAETPWLAALDLACDWAAGATSQDEAAARITQGVNSQPLLSYTPATMFGWTTYLLSSFLSKLQAGNPFQLNCTDCADAVTTLANLLGCDLWEGRMLSLTTRKILGIGGNPAVEADWKVWPWSYHEIPWLTSIGPNQSIYDGCLQVDKDTNDADTVHIPYLALKIKFSDYYKLLTGNLNYTLENIPRRRPVA